MDANAPPLAAPSLAVWDPPRRAVETELAASLRACLADAPPCPLLLVRTDAAMAPSLARVFEACVPCRSAEGPVAVGILLAGRNAPGGAHAAFVLRRALGDLAARFCIAADAAALSSWVAAHVPSAVDATRAALGTPPAGRRAA